MPGLPSHAIIDIETPAQGEPVLLGSVGKAPEVMRSADSDRMAVSRSTVRLFFAPLGRRHDQFAIRPRVRTPRGGGCHTGGARDRGSWCVLCGP